jgi:hypothetical protein
MCNQHAKSTATQAVESVPILLLPHQRLLKTWNSFLPVSPVGVPVPSIDGTPRELQAFFELTGQLVVEMPTA